VQVSTSQVFLDHFIHHRPKEPILFLAMLIIAGLEIFMVVARYLPQGRIGGLSGVVGRRMGRHKKSFAQHPGALLHNDAGACWVSGTPIA
jgi:hypothetical protein